MTLQEHAISLNLLADLSLPDPNTMSIDDVVVAAERLYAQKLPTEAQQAAVLLFENAFERGDIARSGYRLGTAYYSGVGVARDIEKASLYFDNPALDRTRFAIFYRGVIRGMPQFSGYDECASWRLLENSLASGVAAAEPYLNKLRPRFACPVCTALPDPIHGSLQGPCESCRAPAALRVLVGSMRENPCLPSGRYAAYGLKPEEIKALQRIWPECAGVDDNLAQGVDVLLASNDAAMRLLSNDAAATMARSLGPDGCLVFVAPQLAGLDNPGLKNHFLIRALESSFSVLPVGRIDARSGQPFVVLFCTARSDEMTRQRTRDLKARAMAIAMKNAENERLADCAFSNSYLAHLQVRPGTSYAEFAVTQEAKAVSNAGGAHATLGRNVTDASRLQGLQNFQKYGNILNVRATERVLEYGCGSLRVGAGFIRLVAPGCFFAMDVVPEFFEIGKTMVDIDDERRGALKFSPISDEGVEQGVAFGADHVFASAVIFHIHPNDICFAMSNLARLAGKPGAKLIFDAKVARGPEPQRYAQKDRKGGWAWPLEFYQAALAPLELVQVHDRIAYDWAPEVDFAHLEFRAPFTMQQ